MKALIIFGSTTGNTEQMAATVGTALEEAGVDTEIKNVTDADVGDLTGDHDLLILGCPAYGNDEIELQDDFEDFYETIDDGIKLDGKKCAVFAPGDSAYEYYCGSVDMLEERLEELGGKLVASGLKIDGDPDDFEDETAEWAKAVVSACK